MAIPKGSQYEKAYDWEQRRHYVKTLIDTLNHIADIYIHKQREEAMNAFEYDLETLLFKYTQSPKFNPDKEED